MQVQNLTEKFYNYSLHIRCYSLATIRRYKYVLDFYQKYGVEQEVHQITESSLRELFLFGRSERKWKTTTYLVFSHSLKVFFEWCLKEGLIPINPMTGIEIPKIDSALPQKLTKQDAFILLETIQNFPHYNQFLKTRNYAIFSMFLFAGLRRQELLNLKLSDVDVTNLSLLVRKGKGNKDRYIPMSFKLLQSLRKYLEHRNRMCKMSTYFFLSSNRDAGLEVQGLKKIAEQIRNASGIWFTIHKLRHTFATLMLEGGCDIYSLSKMMGHSDIKTTTIYLYASAEHLRSQMTKHPMNDL
jgi:site-specific recombinase XerD